jgi:hypothetical protein
MGVGFEGAFIAAAVKEPVIALGGVALVQGVIGLEGSLAALSRFVGDADTPFPLLRRRRRRVTGPACFPFVSTQHTAHQQSQLLLHLAST